MSNPPPDAPKECELSPGGFDVVNGRTALAQRLVVTEIGTINDNFMWFHAEAPGAHVVMRAVPSRATQADIDFAARTAGIRQSKTSGSTMKLRGAAGSTRS